MTNQVVLRDDKHARWLHFSEPVEIVTAARLDEVLPALQRIQQITEMGLHAAGFIAYEAAPAFDSALRVNSPDGKIPLLWFGLYPPPLALDHLPDPDPSAYTLGDWQPTIKRPAFESAVDRIKEHIARGDTYQVNHTLRLRFPFSGDPWKLFLTLQRAQQAPFGAYIDAEDFAICSASPELFFTLDGDALTSRPMKGTADRGRNLIEDEANRRWLHHSPKNRAENVMIVDMIRNDIGRVADIGSVQTPRLFEVERYPTVLQMTSTVQGRTQASLTEILSALFPCASITGAPKVRTMQIIADLETTPRGVYTGAVGFIAPGGAQHKRRAQFNVAIRTVTVDKLGGQAEYGVGSGIVWDSVGADEYHECQVKARILTDPPPLFSLLESLLWRPPAGYWLLDRHLQRLSEAATFFVIPLHLPEARAALLTHAASLPASCHKVRLLVSGDGAVSCESAPISAPISARPLRLALALDPVNRADAYLYHKTSRRQVYERARASCPDCDDVLLWNDRGEITESCSANIVVSSGGGLFTPPVESGLLAGTLRAELLARGIISERVISKNELAGADAIYLINSVRGWRRAQIRPTPAQNRR